MSVMHALFAEIAMLKSEQNETEERIGNSRSQGHFSSGTSGSELSSSSPEFAFNVPPGAHSERT